MPNSGRITKGKRGKKCSKEEEEEEEDFARLLGRRGTGKRISNLSTVSAQTVLSSGSFQSNTFHRMKKATDVDDCVGGFNSKAAGVCSCLMINNVYCCEVIRSFGPSLSSVSQGY